MEGLVEEIVVGAVGSAGGDVARLADSWLFDRFLVEGGVGFDRQAVKREVSCVERGVRQRLENSLGHEFVGNRGGHSLVQVELFGFRD